MRGVYGVHADLTHLSGINICQQKELLAMLYALTALILDRPAWTTDYLFLAEPRRPVQKLSYWYQVKVSVDKGRELG